MANLYLIPNQLSPGDWNITLPVHIKEVVGSLRYFIVENVRNSRRFLKMIDKEIIIDDLIFFELNEHTRDSEFPEFLMPMESGYDVGIISEAGCPGVADPGAGVVKLAHQKGYKIIPLVGPSSILLALMASGMNGQNFTFSGYLPVKSAERTIAIRQLEKKAWEANQTQVFIETPYRNNQLLTELLNTLKNDTLLGIAADLTGENEYVSVTSVSEWKKRKSDFHHRPAVFLIGRP
jgi:16S rRNA (cytidine1402-2'-O)-methyltransferase